MGRRRTGRQKDVTRPPEGQPWIWHQLDLLQSPAWRGRSINCIRLIEFLLIEHMGHGGMENGRLAAPYNHLVAFGITRRLIPGAISEAEERGLIDVDRGGRRGTVYNDVSRYRLTFYATRTKDAGTGWWTWIAPTDEWRRYGTEEA